MATSLISELLWTFAHSFTFINHLSTTRTCGLSPTNVVHPWCPRFILRDSSFCSFGSRFSCLPSCSLVLFSWVFYNSENWPWTLSNLLGILWLVQQGNPESEKFLLVDSRIRENFTCGLRNTTQGIRNLTNDWNPKSRFHRQRLESSTWNTNSTAWNPEFKTVLDSLIFANNSFVCSKWQNG